MDNQHLYDEAMAKLAEAQTSQNDIIDSSVELQRLRLAISTTIHYATLSSLRLQYNNLILSVNKKTKERDDKLNEAIGKALDLVEDEVAKRIFCPTSSSVQAMVAISSYIKSQDIHLYYSADVNTKRAKIFAKGISELHTYLKMFGW